MWPEVQLPQTAWEEWGASGVCFWLGHWANLCTTYFYPLSSLSHWGEHLFCCVGAAAAWGHCCGIAVGGVGVETFYKVVSADKCRGFGFFPLHKACLRCFPKLSMQICKRSSPVPQNKLDEICE